MEEILPNKMCMIKIELVGHNSYDVFINNSDGIGVHENCEIIYDEKISLIFFNIQIN
jgi:hypothetical protein